MQLSVDFVVYIFPDNYIEWKNTFNTSNSLVDYHLQYSLCIYCFLSFFVLLDHRFYLFHLLDEIMNLDEFISMSSKMGEGVVKDMSGFAEYFEVTKLPD